MSDQPMQWWQPALYRDKRPFLIRRNLLMASLRKYFSDENFTEVETAILQVSPGNEAHLHAFATQLLDADLSQHQRYLHTSPEFACKKLLAAGEARIFTFAKVFRNRERTATHHPEFTMLEWYRTREPYQVLMADCERILALAAEAGGCQHWQYRGIAADPLAEPEKLSVAEAFQRFAGIDLLATLDAVGAPDREALAASAVRQGLRVAPDDTWSDIFSGVLVEKVEPFLGHGRATILYEYPAVEAALARRTGHDLRLSERFELYVCGVELANGFGELTDPAEQRRRFESEMAEKQRVYGEFYPLDEDFLEALAIMPPASGIALGLDRLAMLATGARNVNDVIWAPVA